MAVYDNINKASPIVRMETDPVPDGNFIFFHIDKPENKEKIKQWLTSKTVGQEIIAEAMLDGKPVLVTHGDKTKDDMMKLLEARGDKLEPYQYKPPFSERAWKTGAVLAFIGQGMQLISSGMRPNRKVDWSLRFLAIPNLIATTWILLYGAQRTPDDHKLRAIKTGVNDVLDDYMPNPALLPDVDDKRAVLRQEPHTPTFKEKLDGFLKRYSVIVGEIGLRYAGAVSLAFKFDNWPGAWRAFRKDGIKAAYYAGRTVTPGASQLTGPYLTHGAGLLSLAGKTVALSAKAPDPYNPDNPEPGTWAGKIQNFREKISFRLGGWMETVAFASIAADGFLNKKISFKQSLLDKAGKPLASNTGLRKPMPDFISGIGGSLFTIRYIIRHWAPFGVKEMDMKEMYAHAVDALALIPPASLSKAMAESAAEITHHFKSQNLEYSQVFRQLMDQLYKDRHIALDNLGTEPEERLAKFNARLQPANGLKPRAAIGWVTSPADKHVEKVNTPGEVYLGLGA